MSFEDEDLDDDVFSKKKENENENEQTNDTITINIKNVQGENDSYEIKLTEQVSSLIEKYSSEKNLKGNSKVIFTFKGKNINPKSTFKDVGVESDDTIHVLIRLQGGFN